MEINKSLQNYLDELSSSSPTPGGGNVAALCGVLSASLGVMVCNLTIGKKKYLDVEPEIKEIKDKLERAKESFIRLAQKDNEAFNGVMDAFKMPKETDEEKEKRSIQIEAATLKAAIIPAEVIKECANNISLIQRSAEIGNQNSVSDAGVAASLLITASEGAFLNVLINCSSITNNKEAMDLLAASEKMNNQMKEKAGSILASIKNKLKV
jgi:formiminotetrahydrofolate cyclodeaminase